LHQVSAAEGINKMHVCSQHLQIVFVISLVSFNLWKLMSWLR